MLSSGHAHGRPVEWYAARLASMISAAMAAAVRIFSVVRLALSGCSVAAFGGGGTGDAAAGAVLSWGSGAKLGAAVSAFASARDS